MDNYEHYSKEELIQRVRTLEKEIAGLKPAPPQFKDNISFEFKKKHGCEILEILPDMLSVFDHDYNYIALASSEKTIHVGDSSENLIGKNLKAILPPEAYKPVKENFDRVVKTGSASIGYHNLFVDGKLENFENRVIPLNKNYILCICRNITETIKAQSQLQMVISAVNNSLEEIYAVQTDGKLIFANKEFIHHYEITARSSYIFDILPDLTEAEWQENVTELRNSRGSANFTKICRLPNGTNIPKEMTVLLLKNRNGDEVVWTITRDISERIERENKIKELNKLMDTILNNIPVYLFVKDTGNDFRYLYWNKEFEKRSHIPASHALGKTDLEIFPSREDAEKFRRDDLELVKDNKTVEFEEEYLTATNEKRIVHTMKTLIPLEGKKPLLIGIAWDITEQKKTEGELIQAKIKAEESDKLKSAFLANMSHEIRTPLNAIVGFSKLMAETEDITERKQYSEIVDKNTDLLLQLINDILDLSKIEAGMLEFSEKEINLNVLCQDLYESSQPRLPLGVSLIYKPYPETLTIVSDSNRLAQVLLNLLNNAQKFTKQGEISFGFYPHGNWIEFFVKDTGIGISKANIDKIFNRFVKLNNFAQGTGLGLPICRMIIENLGGEIWVKSEENVGTEFCFTLPLKK